jgi:hypothetical protein
MVALEQGEDGGAVVGVAVVGMAVVVGAAVGAEVVVVVVVGAAVVGGATSHRQTHDIELVEEPDLQPYEEASFVLI